MIISDLFAALIAKARLTIAFALASVASAMVLWRAPKHEVRTSVRVYSILVTVALLMATFYLAYWGVIGWRTWA